MPLICGLFVGEVAGVTLRVGHGGQLAFAVVAEGALAPHRVGDRGQVAVGVIGVFGGLSLRAGLACRLGEAL